MKKPLLKHLPQELPKPTFERFGVKPVNYFREVIQHHETPEEKPAARASAAERQRTSEPRISAAQVETARSEGMREGLERGREEAARELQQAFQLLDQSAKLLNAERDEVSSRFQSQLVSLATQMAKKILDSELSLKPDLLLSIVSSALNSAKDANQVTLKVHPEDMALIKSHHESLKQSLGTNVAFDLKPDSSVGRGGCTIDTELGSLDARLATQLETLRSQLDQRIGAQ